MPRTRFHIRAFLAGAALIVAASPWARGGDDADHELARRLLAEGRIKPLAEIMGAIHKEVPGEMLEVEFEAEDGRYVYEFKILTPHGAVQEIEVDAATGKVLEVEDDD